MTKNTKALVSQANETSLSELKNQYPIERGFQRILLPRLSMASQDKYEGKGKTAKLIKEAGIFTIERQTDEEDDTGKKIWLKEELGNKVEGIVIYQRKQLRLYDEKTEMYTSSPIYDEDDQIIPLFCNKKEVVRGTPAELKAEYQYKDKAGKTKSKLEDNRILYFLKDDEIFQLSLRGSSMYSWMTFARKVLPPSVLIELSSEAMEKGQIKWNKMIFEVVKPLNTKEVTAILAKIKEIKEGIQEEKNYYAAVKQKDDNELEVIATDMKEKF